MEQLQHDSLKERFENDFSYHPPKDGQDESFTLIRSAAKNMANVLLKLCPASREFSLALTKLDETVFWANASIARNE